MPHNCFLFYYGRFNPYTDVPTNILGFPDRAWGSDGGLLGSMTQTPGQNQHIYLRCT